MPLRGIFDPEQLAVLTKALQDYCNARDIKPDTPAFEAASLLVLSLYERGFNTAAGLAKALEGATIRP